jgi:hypothetical protein
MPKLAVERARRLRTLSVVGGTKPASRGRARDRLLMAHAGDVHKPPRRRAPRPCYRPNPWKGKLMLGANNVFDKKPRIIYDTASTFGGTTSSSAGSELPVDRFVYVRYNQKFRSGLQPNKQGPPGEPGGHFSFAGARGRKKSGANAGFSG